MSDPPMLGDETWKAPGSEGPGGRIGPFKILQQLGEGGFGSVYEAEQEQPVRRRVALKVIKLGMDTREVIARFEAERQALALMDHPHIARVLDAGATESGRPYFVMELVKGEPISKYCEKHDLSIIERLELFEQVCEAVQHAHTKGIIHRDLKPSNVMVSTHDDRPFARVIDFGIAKAASGRLTDKTLYTEANLMMGTPAYMSPEQAEGSADIDTRTDIYSLGVILYELLTDTTPLDSNSLRVAGYAEVQRIIREVEPPRPSVRLAKSTLTKVGENGKRSIEPRKLVRIVRGELDWIAMKAIEKDRTRRYETANGLAMDIRRYLAGEAVLAAPPSAIYRMQKFVRRNKTAVAAGSLVAAALVVGIVGFAWQARVAREQERIAKQRADEIEKVSKYQAAMLDQIDTTLAGKQLSDDVQTHFEAALVHDGVPEPERSKQTAVFAAQWRRINATDTATRLIDSTLLKPAVIAIDRQLHDQPAIDASLRQVLAGRYYALGLYDEAMPLQRSALATRIRVLGETDVQTLTSMVAMGALLDAQGNFNAAEPYLRQATASSLRYLGPDNADTLEARSYLAQVLRDEGKSDEAEAILRDVLARRLRTLGKNDESTLVSQGDLGGLLVEKHELKQAEPFLRAAADGLRRMNGEDDIDSLTSSNNLGIVLVREGKREEAEALFRKVLDKRRRLLGEEHPDTLQSQVVLGGLLTEAQRLDEAEPLLREASEKRALVLGEQDPGTVKAREMYGKVLLLRGRYADVDALMGPSSATARKVLAESDPTVLGLYLTILGKAHLKLGRFDDAQNELIEAEAIDIRNLTPADPEILAVHQALVELYAARNAAEPGNGYDAKAAEWAKKLAQNGAAATH